MQVPGPLKTLFSYFPLYTHPPLHPQSKSTLEGPTIWVYPPKHSSDNQTAAGSTETVLSSDVECLKWQAYIALRGLSKIRVRFDVDAQGAVDGRLPNLHVPFDASAAGDGYSWRAAVQNAKNTDTGNVDNSSELLSAPQIVEWVDVKLAHSALDDEWEGYRDEAAKDESRAWVALLEGDIHAALILSEPPKSFLSALLSPPTPSPSSTTSLKSILIPPPPPSTGFFSILPSYSFSFSTPFGTTSGGSGGGVRISSATRKAVFEKYAEAIKALSEKLGTDKWFLGSEYPTPLDALIFAYLHCILQSPDIVRTEVTRRVNLVAWEWRVRGMVKAAFIKA
ncbi:hypothetical protein GYMLUDRAFT_245254 [Collybiopsis luxurians FD-317 M1]|uniref:Metaxin glutathione S-transferase domain-containing protein n=1 Tax=Collybiopsis luxurians FD-317 M1 TaxID=944289 RepID=A0A0D0CAU9_9AGAR|nr:hypothetical protein GYMLUDRAFT_245254 [Collybiopsis luxurians FD-317 M1]